MADDDDTTPPGDDWLPPDEDAPSEAEALRPWERRPRDEDTLPTENRPAGDEERSPGRGELGDDAEDELPATGAHEIVFPDEDAEEERLADHIPSFEEYRRQREAEMASHRDPAQPGGDSGAEEPWGAADDGEADEDDDREVVRGGDEYVQRMVEHDSERGEADEDDDREAVRGGDEYRRMVGQAGERGEVDEDDDGEAAGGDEYAQRMFGGAGEGEGPGEDDGDTLDGADALEGVSLPEAGDADGTSFEGGYEQELAREAADIFPTGDEHTAEEIRQRRLEAHRRHRRNGRIRLLILVVVVALIVVGVAHEVGGGTSKPGKPPPKPPATPTTVGTGKGFLQKGRSDSGVLPDNLLIADWGSHKLVVISPKGQVVWTYHPTASYLFPFYPDYAFFTPSGKEIVVAEEGPSWVEALRIAGTKVVYTYGTYGHPGSVGNHLHDPSTALAEGSDVVISDLLNCRVLTVKPPFHAVVTSIGKSGACTHDPPGKLDQPASAFPLRSGGTVVTELGDGYVDVLNANGTLAGSFKVPGLARPANVNETGTGDLIGVDHAHPGAVVIFTTAGKVLWSYRPHGRDELLDPAIAYMLPNGDVLVSDEYNDRVIVVDRKTKKIVWQYGRTGAPGGGSGYLDVPVGLELVPPHSLADQFPRAKPPR